MAKKQNGEAGEVGTTKIIIHHQQQNNSKQHASTRF